MIAVSAISSFMLIRFGYRLPMILGIVLVAISLFLVGQSWHNVSVFGHGISSVVLLSVLIMISGFGVGVGGPAANNAAIELMPEAVARITGLRSMFRTTGGVLGTAAIVLLLAHDKNEGAGLAHIFVGLSFLVLLVIPPIFLIPDGARMRRKAADMSIHSRMDLTRFKSSAARHQPAFDGVVTISGRSAESSRSSRIWAKSERRKYASSLTV